MATFTKRIDADIRDVGYVGVDPFANSALSLGNPGAVVREISLRFISVTIPQGATISSAKITFTGSGVRNSQVLAMKVYGVDEDNTAEFVISPEDTAKTRTHTTATIDWDATISTTDGSTHDTSDITSIVKEIVDRGSWSNGNAMGFHIGDDGSGSGHYINVYEYSSDDTKGALLTITYEASSESASISATPSPSISATESASPSLSGTPSSTPSATESASPSASESASPSVSISASPSASVSESASISATESASPSPSPSSTVSPSSSISATPSASNSPSPSPAPPETMKLLVAKDGENALTEDNPTKFKFHSDYGTLKYHDKQTIATSFDANDGNIACTGSFAHNLGYYPFVEVFVRVYLGDTPSGNYEYCPFSGAGATVLYSANYIITTSGITVYGMINGVSSSVWHFDFLVFIYKNDLGF